jgi:hypothetical protein
LASLLFTCPITHHRAPTGIETDVQSLQATWKATLKVKCPHCGGMHEVSVRDTYIDAALQDATGRFGSAL